MIIQGSNKPIIIQFDDVITGNMTNISVTLERDGTVLKHWDMADLVIDGNTASANLTQEETKGFSVGPVMILVKWLDSDGVTAFGERYCTSISRREDRNYILGGD